MQLLLAPFASLDRLLVIFPVSVAFSTLIVLLVLRSARTAEERSSGWTRRITSINAKYLFGILFVGWAVFFGIVLQIVPHEGANSPYGGLGLLAMFSGVFIMFGFLWAVIGD